MDETGGELRYTKLPRLPGLHLGPKVTSALGFPGRGRHLAMTLHTWPAGWIL